MDIKEICLELIRSETEIEVINILKKNDLWDKDAYWLHFGANENNYATIGNQQSKPEAAIVEKIINSVDAMLMSECLKRKIKPESQNAPIDIKSALKTYFEIDEGKLTNLTPSERSKIADNICLVATGSKQNPTYSIIDKGEGQTPASLHNTILSLGKSNKLRIPFVQGKYNMGGTGVFRFCGKHNIQLIISRRNPEITQYEIDPTKDAWGFTIIKRVDPSKSIRSSSYKYLAPNNQILFFQSDGLPILPGNYPDAYKNSLNFGTYIKFFEYQIGPSLRTIAILDLYYKLSLLLPNIALPIKIFERREGYRANSYETILSGLSVRIDEDRSENIEDGYPSSGQITVDSQTMSYSIYVFKRNKAENYTKDEGIIFTINGQTHGYLTKAFFNRKAVGLGYLADSVLVILDCSEFDGRSREDLFMNSRDRLSNCELKNHIEEELEEILKSHQGLRELKEKRRKEEIENKLKDSKPLVHILEDILKKSPTLSKLFIQGSRLHNPFKTETGKKEVAFVGKKFPTYFTLVQKFTREKAKNVHLNTSFRIQYKTDAVNDYFSRSKEPGVFDLLLNNIKVENVSINLWNGIATINVPIQGVPVGEILEFLSILNDISRIEPFEEAFCVKVIEPITKCKSIPGQRKPPVSDEEGKDTPKVEGLDLPSIIPVTRDEWQSHNFNEYSALKVKGDEIDGYDFYINVDNIHLLSEIKASKNVEPQILMSKYKFGLVLIGLALLNSENNESLDENEDKDIFQEIEKITKLLSPIIIPMIENLSEIDITEINSMQEN